MAPPESKPSDNPPPVTNGDKKVTVPKVENPSNAEPGQPLAPPPKPGESGDDYFSSKLSLEPNPFEESFSGGAVVETPGGTKLPSVAALTSPSSLLPGNGNTPFNWGGGSLRTGPLSPAMLSGPAADYFGDTSHSLRGGFTPNESSLRTGLTPGGSGSMFPAASPNSAALFNQLASGTATPGTLDFQRTALNAAKARNAVTQPPTTSQPQDTASNGVAVKTESKPVPGAFDPHDNDAANGLFMLAQGAQQRNGAAPANQQYPVGGNQPVHAHPHPAPVAPTNTSPQMNGNGSSVGATSIRGVSEAASGASEEMEQNRTTARGKKRGSGAGTTNGRRKADEPPSKQPANKKAKTAAVPAPPSHDGEEEHTSEEDGGDHDDDDDSKPKSKMTDEEKRKNFLERNRVAALKCRQRKKQWLANLQNKVEIFSSENDALTAQISQLREEVVNLKTLLLAHKDCPVTQQQGLHGAFMQQAMETYNPQMNPYGMAAPPMASNQPVMAGQPRRYS